MLLPVFFIVWGVSEALAGSECCYEVIKTLSTVGRNRDRSVIGSRDKV